MQWFSLKKIKDKKYWLAGWSFELNKCLYTSIKGDAQKLKNEDQQMKIFLSLIT